MLRLNGRDLLFGEAKVSLANLYPCWINWGFLLPSNIRRRARPVGENGHIVMCGDSLRAADQGKTVNWREIPITLKTPFLGLAGVNERIRLVSSTILRSD